MYQKQDRRRKETGGVFSLYVSGVYIYIYIIEDVLYLGVYRFYKIRTFMDEYDKVINDNHQH